jgi:hypothetical protein
MFTSLYDLSQQFLNWLTTGSGAIPPQNGVGGMPPPPAPPAPPQLNLGQRQHIGGNLSDQIANDPRAVAIRIAASANANGGIPVAPPPPMNGLNVMAMNVVAPAMSLQEELRSEKVRAIRVRANVRSREGDRGHVLARHHPSLTDMQLKNRLLTGLDPEGNPAPTSGVSSRFASEQLFFKSLQQVHQRMAVALNNSVRYLRSNLVDCANAEAAFLAAAPGPAKRQAQLERAQAYNDFRSALQVIPSLNDHLPLQWDDGRRCLILYPKYAINLYQGEQLGVGFYGTGPKPNTVVGGKTMTIYERTQPFTAPAESTLTVFTTPDSPMNALGRKHNIENWGLITHYPQSHEGDNVRIEGSN